MKNIRANNDGLTELQSTDTEFQSTDTEIKLDGANGIKLKGSSIRDISLEIKIDDRWVKLPYISKISIECDMVNFLPKVTITQWVIPK